MPSRGTMDRDAELMELEAQHVEERKTRKRCQFPNVNNLTDKASTDKVDNNQNWKDIGDDEEETVKSQEFLEALARAPRQ